MGTETDGTEDTQTVTALSRLNHIYAAFARCQSDLARASDESAVLGVLCTDLVNAGDYRYVWVGYASGDPTSHISAKVGAGPGGRHFAAAVGEWANDAVCPSPCRTAVLTNRPVLISDLESEAHGLAWRGAAMELGCRSMIALPLEVDGRVIGNLSMFSGETNGFTEDEVRLLPELAAGLALGIDAARESANRDQQLRRLREEVEQQEQRRIAATLHDGVGQTLLAVNLGIKRLRGLVGGEQPVVDEILQQLVAEVGDAIHELREISHELRPRFLEHMALHEAIRFHCAELEKRTGVHIRCLVDQTPYSLGDRAKAQCFLSFREALGNALKHSGASRIEVSLAPEATGWLKIRVKDNGKGFDQGRQMEHPTGLGLSMIAERAMSVGGNAEIHSKQGEGTEVSVTVPLS